jgi:Na+/melibiose symporter-like transporter
MMPKYADMATAVDATAMWNPATHGSLNAGAQYRTCSDANAMANTYNVKLNVVTPCTEWGAWTAFPGPANYMTKKGGFPCDKQLQVMSSTNVTTIFNFTLPGAPAAFGNDICRSFVSLKSVCWPGPAGSSKVGDGGPRVCSFTAGEDMALYWFITAIIGRIGWESLWMLSNATKWEVYPWVEERVKNNIFSALSTALGVITFAILSIPIGNAHEMGSMPNGGHGNRFVFSIITTALCCLGYLAVGPWMDAKQASDKHVKATNQFAEWKEIMTAKTASPMRWVTFTYFMASMQGTFTVSSVVYYFVYVSMVPVGAVGLAVGGVAFLTLFIETICAVIWNCIFGQKGKNDHGDTDRANSKSSQKIRWYMLILHIVSAVLAVLGGIFVAPPAARTDADGNAKTGSPLQLMIYMTIFRVPGSIYSLWLNAASGWAIDEDYQLTLKEQGKAKRREASWAGLRLFFRGIGGMLGIIMISSVMGGAGFTAVCDSTIAPKDQPKECAEGLWRLWAVYNPIWLIIMGVSGFLFPIKGDRLVTLIENQATAQKAIPGTKAISSVKYVLTPEATEAAGIASVIKPAETEVPAEE